MGYFIGNFFFFFFFEVVLFIFEVAKENFKDFFFLRYYFVSIILMDN